MNDKATKAHDPHSKNPLHQKGHPHHLPHALEQGGKVDPDAVAKGLALMQDGVIDITMESETPIDDKTDRVTVIRKYLK